MADTNEVEALTTVEVYQKGLKEAFSKLKEVATDVEFSQAKDATITFLQDFVQKEDGDDPSTHEEAQPESEPPKVTEDTDNSEHSKSY